MKNRGSTLILTNLTYSPMRPSGENTYYKILSMCICNRQIKFKKYKITKACDTQCKKLVENSRMRHVGLKNVACVTPNNFCPVKLDGVDRSAQTFNFLTQIF